LSCPCTSDHERSLVWVKLVRAVNWNPHSGLVLVSMWSYERSQRLTNLVYMQSVTTIIKLFNTLHEVISSLIAHWWLCGVCHETTTCRYVSLISVILLAPTQLNWNTKNSTYHTTGPTSSHLRSLWKILWKRKWHVLFWLAIMLKHILLLTTAVSK